jgi:hypothetical protein
MMKMETAFGGTVLLSLSLISQNTAKKAGSKVSLYYQPCVSASS